ncbi:kinase-like domain-containing protein [Rhizophagus diaphanus]|nr:kinase-like domain-containing protein [Rhizophagus diaphanus] [Rhizophagus sp. MUCL 43196]
MQMEGICIIIYKKIFQRLHGRKNLYILWRISDGLQTIHEKNFIHRDFHSGNILVEIIENIDQYLIGDLGLSQPANNTLSSNEIYGVIPYIAPEIFKGVAFSRASDIYSMGMIMWELTTGCKPFANVEHDTDLIYEIIDGKRPKITDDTPEDFVNLMKKCWNSDPKKRPSAKKVCESLYFWANMGKDANQFNQAEEIRLQLIQSKLLGPEFSEKTHSKAIYTSRSLSSFTSKSSSNSLMNSLRQNYVTKEVEFDIDDNQRPSGDTIVQNSSSNSLMNSLKQKYVTKEVEFDE